MNRQRLKTIIVFGGLIKSLLRRQLPETTVPADAAIVEIVTSGSEGKLYVLLEHDSFPELSPGEMLRQLATAPQLVDLQPLPDTDGSTEARDDPCQPQPGFFRSVKHFRITTAEREVIEFELLAEGRQFDVNGFSVIQPSLWLVTNVRNQLRRTLEVPHTDECDRPLWVANWWYLQIAREWDSLNRPYLLAERWHDLRSEMLAQDDNLHRRQNILPRSLVQPVNGVFVHSAEGEVSHADN